MSGICGILRLDGAPPAGLTRMTDRLERRGPEGTRHWRNGPCALGHTLLATTPEALHEAQPLTHGPTGCTITADLRLDNREVLIPALGLDGQGRVIGDAEIALMAYLKWGEDCVRHLAGDFALAIWDPRYQHLFCARDRMGLKQLIHAHVPGRVFAFASEPRAVIEAEGVPRQINEARIADFLEGYLEAIDATSTFLTGVFRLPPAHVLTAGPRGVTIRRYWTLEPVPVLRLASDSDYEEGFREVFTRAVRRRLRAPEGAVGSMLSGGMDSGSIVAVASRILAAEGRGPLPTFSGVGPHPETCIETRSIHAALGMPGLDPHLVNWAKLDGWQEELTLARRNSEEPFDWSMEIIRAVYLAARRTGVKVVFDGIGGDIVFAPGTINARLLVQGAWPQLWREARGEEEFWGHGWRARKSLLWALRQALIPYWMRQARFAWRTRFRSVPPASLVHPDLATRVDLRGRIDHWDRRDAWRWKPYQEERIRSILALEVVIGLERYDRIAGTVGVEPRDPFLDPEVIAWCLSLPMRQLQRDGWPKHLLRRAMDGLMPDTVRWRKGKEHVGWKFVEQLMREPFVEQGLDPLSGDTDTRLKQWIRSPDHGQRSSESVNLQVELAKRALSDWLGSMRYLPPDP